MGILEEVLAHEMGLEVVFAHGMGFLLPLIVVGLGHGVEYYCWSVTVVDVLKKGC